MMFRYSAFSSSETLVLGVVVFLLVAVIACGTTATATPVPPAATSTPGSGTTLDSAGSPTPVPTVQAAATPNPTPVKIVRSLTYVTVDEPTGLDFTRGWGGGSIEFFRDNYNDTLTWKPTGTDEIAPRLAEKWEQLAPDQWRWTLRKDVKFHNGAQFDANAAAFALNLAFTHENPPGYVGYLGVTEVQWEVVDPFTVMMNCAVPCPIAPLASTFTELWQEPGWYQAASEEEKARTVVGNGPYKLMEWTPGVSITHEAFQDYWQGAPEQIKEATVVWRLEEVVRAAMVTTGEADLAVSIGTQNLEAVPKTVVGGSSEVIILRINIRDANRPFQDIQVRQALLYAIDCQSLAESLYDGQAECRGAPFSPGTVGSRPDIQKPYPYDPQKARDLLAEANYAQQWPNYEIKVSGRQGRFPRDVELAEAIVGYWNAVGFKATAEILDHSLFSNLLYSGDKPEGAGDILLAPHGNEIGEGGRTASQWLNCDRNLSTVCQDDVQQQLIEAVSAIGAEREEKLYHLFKRSYDEVLFPGLLELPVVYGLQTDLDFQARPDRRVRWNDQVQWLK
jgi:peptide/nickel transport system substrate-binding protein